MENLYDLSARFYDLRYKNIQFEKYRQALGYVKLQGKILDHGCGTGLLYKFSKCENLIGVDNSKEMLEIAKAKGMDVRFGDIEKLPFDANRFDVVLSFTTLQNSKNPQIALREIRRVLKNNGSLILSFLHQFDEKLSPLIKRSFYVKQVFRNGEDVTYICQN